MVNYNLEVRGGRNSWVRWRVGTKRASITLLPLLAGHPANMRWYPLAAVSVPFDVMVFPRTGFGHLDKDLLSSGFAQPHLINREDSRISCFVYDKEVSSLYDRDKKVQVTDGF